MYKRKRAGPYYDAGRTAWKGGYARKRYRRRGTFHQRIGYGSVARTRGAPVRGEMKYFDCEHVAAAIALATSTWVAGTIMDPSSTINLGDAAVATPQCLFAPKVSAALNGRIGRSVCVKKIKLNGIIFVPAQAAQAATDPSTKVRIILVQDMQTNSAQMTGAQLMNDTTSAGATVCSYQNPNNFGRFRVLRDKSFVLQDPNMAGDPAVPNVVQGSLTKLFKMSYRFRKPVEPRFNATNGGTVADIVDHSFHVLAIANSITLAPTLTYYSRVSYKE